MYAWTGSSLLKQSLHPDSKVHGANMGPIWGRQDPGGPHVGPMNFAICVTLHYRNAALITIADLDSGSSLGRCQVIHRNPRVAMIPTLSSLEPGGTGGCRKFQTWHLIGWQHSCQPIKTHVRKSWQPTVSPRTTELVSWRPWVFSVTSS